MTSKLADLKFPFSHEEVKATLSTFFAKAMTADGYSERAAAFIDPKGSQIEDLLHGALGVAGEGGEVVDIIKKAWAYGKPLDHAHLIEEIGDAMWYYNLIIRSLGVTWGEVFSANVAKLSARYPDKKFSAHNALNRDKVAEQAALNSVTG
ncbi:nucleoside triphosphate pyrophosphohydrolase family protein [Ferribacterium limneticum]|uniref:nucleoside triphosphate pyrophosphohydrolase family protein n=1 Tax=Ferribacterium limneticum TaxID=76259 RepID=UPI001CF86A07|nr:nucleoside triphosphate pyrophosphohydrolase family protein [Ferribacterium limneticum]UCV26717.1 nucleoside triphosphate pyrophosphohydrolase family protein [Ferribacterium limneticum]UCV30634.1 nucleoside triphosphate pyrophosphohydrolase family protein [Ferribacterium limneticum]